MTLTRIAALLLVAAATSALATGRVDPQLLAAGWHELTFERKPANRFERVREDTVRVTSEAAVSILQRPVQIDLDVTPVLTWRWRVDETVPATDLTRKGGDDRSLAIFVTFSIPKRMKPACSSD